MFKQTSAKKRPSTSGLSSCKYLHVCSALDLPKLSSSRKKLTPKSSSCTVAASRMVYCPIPAHRHINIKAYSSKIGTKLLPGRTRFLSVSTPITPGPELTRRRCASSSAACPLAAHRRSCLSYFFSFAVGPWRTGGVIVPDAMVWGGVKLSAAQKAKKKIMHSY
jgi:hypothetical protein